MPLRAKSKKSKTLLIKHTLGHSENGEIYTLGDNKIYQEKKKEPRKEKKIEPPTQPEIPDLKIQEPPEIPDLKIQEPPEIPDSKIPYSKIPEETIESIHKKLNKTINKLQISTRKTESLCMYIWLFYILVGIYCVLNYLV